MLSRHGPIPVRDGTQVVLRSDVHVRPTPVGYVVWADGAGFSVPADGEGAVSVAAAAVLHRAIGESRRVRFEHARLVEVDDIDLVADHARGSGRATLELGCGPGVVVERLHRSVVPCDGLDSSADAVARAARRLADSGYAGARFVCADLPSTTFVAQYDSCFVLHDSLWEVTSRWEAAAALRGAQSALRSGGVLLLQVPVERVPVPMSLHSPLEGEPLSLTVSDIHLGHVSGRVTASVAVKEATNETWRYGLSYFPLTQDVIGELASEQGGWEELAVRESFTAGCRWVLLRKGDGDESTKRGL